GRRQGGGPGGGIEGGPAIGQKRPEDNPRPHPGPVQQDRGEGKPRGRPDGRRIPWGDRQQQGQPPGGPVGHSDATDQPEVGDALAEVAAHAAVLPGVSAVRRCCAAPAARDGVVRGAGSSTGLCSPCTVVCPMAPYTGDAPWEEIKYTGIWTHKGWATENAEHKWLAQTRRRPP